MSCHGGCEPPAVSAGARTPALASAPLPPPGPHPPQAPTPSGGRLVAIFTQRPAAPAAPPAVLPPLPPAGTAAVPPLDIPPSCPLL